MNKFKFYKIFIIISLFLILIGCKNNSNNEENNKNEDNRITHIISFFTDCDMDIQDIEVKDGDTLPFIPFLTKEGYTFVSWSENITLPIYESKIFEAIWEKTNYKINYNLSGATNSINNPSTYTIDDFFVFEEPTKPGFIFEGWYLDKDFTKKIERVRKYSTGEIDMYAKFTEITYKINYHLDGGQNNFNNPTSYKYSDTKPIYLNNPSKEDYKFVGWYKEESFINLVTKIETTSQTDYELFARFTKDDLATSYVSFNTNGGNIKIDKVFDYFNIVSKAKATMFLSYDTQHGYNASVSNVTGNTYFYYICLKKTDLENIYEIIDIAYPVNNISVDSFDYCIAWHGALQDKESKASLDFIYENKQTMLGGYVELIDLPDQKANTCDIDIIFYPKSAYASDGIYQYKKPEALPTPTKDGYTFKGWVSSLDGSLSSSYPGYYDSLKITYTAQWIRNDLIGTPIEETINSLNSLMSEKGEITSNLNLIWQVNDCTIAWKSNNTDVISNAGSLTQPYYTQEVTMEATITMNDIKETIYYTLKVPGKFHDISNGVKAGYFYYNNSTSDYTFRNLDIMFMAFLYPTADGGISNYASTGSSTVKNFVTKAHENGVRVIPSINTQNCSTIAASDELIEKFSTTIANFVKEFNLDGVDVDWEWPSSTTEAPNFTKLVKVINKKVKAINPNYLITAAVGSSVYTRYDLKNSIKYLDYISIMSYDMQSGASTFHNSLYYVSGKANYAISKSFSQYSSLVPANKIIIGIPFYGRYWTGSTGVKGGGTYQGSMSYANIYNKYISQQSDQIKEYWDEECQVPYVLDKSDGTFISYDNPKSIDIKAKYVHDNGMAGLMYWQGSQDKGDTLVTAVVEGVNKYFK